MNKFTNAVRRLPDATPVAGQGRNYQYDSIGNRKTVGPMPSSGDMQATYTANELNQYTQRTVPGFVDVMGVASTSAVVTVRDAAHAELPAPVVRQNDYFYTAYSVSNTASAFTNSLEINAVINPLGTNDPDIVETAVRPAFVPQTPEIFDYDDDGNMTSDGRFTYIYNAENRLVLVSNFQYQVSYSYDYQGRMFERTADGVQHDYLWTGWNIVSETSSAGTNVFTWGLDLSGSLQGAGGVGGLVSANLGGTNVFYCADANGNVTGLVGAGGSIAAQYDYDSFGNLLIEDESVFGNPFKFSTKFWDSETGLLHYEFRPYLPNIGRWINRDPIGEDGGLNLYGFVGNAAAQNIDYLGQKRWSYTKAIDQVRSTYNNWRSKYPFASNLMRYWLEENIKGAARGSRRLPDYNPTPSDINEVKRYGISRIRQVILNDLSFAGYPAAHTSSRIDFDYIPYVHNSKMWRAYGGVRIEYISSLIGYKYGRGRTVTGISGEFSIHLDDVYAWPSKWAAKMSDTYAAAKYLEDRCKYRPMAHEMNFKYRFK